MGSAQSILSVQGLRKEYGQITALDGVHLSIDDAQILGLAGPNGSGKTTLIRSILGPVSPTDGRVRVYGTDPASFSHTDRQRLGYMPQHTAIYDGLSVRENVGFFAKLYGVKDRRAAVDSALEFVELRDRADTHISDLSGGMVRRTSLACALVHEPDLLILDEPTVGLDPKLRAEMWRGFRERRDAGATILLSTHYLGEVRHCDRVLFLRAGEVLAGGTPDEIRTRTGTTDMEDAFLELLDGERRAESRPRGDYRPRTEDP